MVETGRTLPINSASLVQSVQAFRDHNQSQVVVLNTGGHWIALKLIPSTQARHNVFFWVIDSMPFNDTASAHVTNMLNTYSRLPIMRLDMQAILPMVQTAENVLAENNDTAGALGHLGNAIAGAIAGDGESFMGNRAFMAIQAQMGRCFNAIRRQSLSLDQHIATIGDSTRMVDFDVCRTFDDFVQVATS